MTDDKKKRPTREEVSRIFESCGEKRDKRIAAMTKDKDKRAKKSKK